MISLHPVVRTALGDLAGLRMNKGPQYASDGAVAILDDTPDLGFHAIRHEGALIGMFKLDPRYPERHDFCTPDEIGVRGVLIDRDHQGRGFGTRAMAALPGYARGFYPAATGLVLTVNAENRHARRSYLAAGFHDTGLMYHGGGLGPQHVLRHRL